MDYNDIRNRLAKVFPRFILDVMDFVEGMHNGFRYTYVNKGRWYERGYNLTNRFKR